jgi:hypothetical protein
VRFAAVPRPEIAAAVRAVRNRRFDYFAIWRTILGNDVGADESCLYLPVMVFPFSTVMPAMTQGDLRNPADLDALEQWLLRRSSLDPQYQIRDDALLPAHWFCIRGELLFIGPKEQPSPTAVESKAARR